MASPPTHLSLDQTALFLDFDGTLAEFVDDPSAVEVGPELLERLSGLQNDVAGALAIVTGRSLNAIDKFLHRRVKVVAGVHGHTIRGPDGTVSTEGIDRDALHGVALKLQAFALPLDGVMIEHKPTAIAVHYRRAPEQEAACVAAVRDAISDVAGFRLQHGKCVVEAVNESHDKGTAIETLMSAAPFAGRVPVFIGDDATDEAGFQVVNRLGGVSIKVGDGETTATARLDGVSAVHSWLATLRGD